ncbi:hypothetical protein [Pedobacter punctiformis]|uniref:Uncharacterized protein n=1 Tax=Pedobacter punctiformis TaxID=3004097 RepID=A0ABT4LA32_9SPHI|nr:hypothetical protein [Pedobacter sp. HCMS5-2]MCZ4244792.1 hypothetical protein [Pedobacter sp. HCMS5-2]
MSGPKEKSKKPGSNYEQEIPKGREPVDHKTVKKKEEKQNIKELDSKNLAKERELSEQPVHPIKKAPKDQ